MANECYGDLQLTDNLKGTYSIMWSLPEFNKVLAQVSCWSRTFFLRHNGSTACRMVIYPEGTNVDTSGFICCALICNKEGTGLTSRFNLLDLTGKKIPLDNRWYRNVSDECNFCCRMICRSDLMMLIPNDSLVVVVHGGYSIPSVVSAKGQEIRTVYKMPPSDYALLYKSGKGADAVISVDGQEIPVHSLVLNDRAKVFTDTAKIHLTKEHVKYTITDFTPDIVKRFVQFLYCGTVGIDNVDTACELVRVGHAYRLEDLKRTCAKYLCAKIRDRNVLRLIIVADANDAAELRCYALDYFAKCKKEIDMERYEADLIERPKLVFDLLCKTKDHWSNLRLLHSVV